MHGRDGEIRCMKCGTVTESDDDLSPALGLPALQGGRASSRPNIVWFGEMPMHMDEIDAVLERCGLFLSIGTSGEVYPAAGFVMDVRRRNRGPTPSSSTSSRAATRPCSTSTSTVPPR